MRAWRSILFTLVLSAFVVRGENPPTDESLSRFALLRTNATRITEKPVKMYDRVATLCRMSLADQRILGTGLPDPHVHKYAHVYVSPDGGSVMTNSGVFPKGVVVLKEKFGDAEGKKTELFTGMVKREAGYNPECGDWEFFTLSADAKKVTSRGKLKSCMSCHVEYNETDFVSKKYVQYPH